jgi:hypothetical protein
MLNMSRVKLFITLLVLATLACSAVEQVLEPQATLAPPPTVGGPGDVTPAPGDTPAATATPIGVATPTLASDATEPAPSLEELGEPPQEMAALQTWLAEAHRGDSAVNDVCAVLRQAQWQQEGDSCQAADLDDDQEEEWLLTLDVSHMNDQESPVVQPLEGHPGDFWIVSAEGVVFMARGPENQDLGATAPSIVEVVDMTGDELPEVITVSTFCGAHTCVNTYQILGAPEGQIENLVQLPQETEPLPGDLQQAISLEYVDEEAVRDETDDGLPDLVIHGGIVGSAGAGIQRARTEVWAWDEEESAIVLADQEWEETGYRVHTLYNANYAFSQEEYEEAAQLYEAVIVDESLEEMEFMEPADVSRAYARQFAGFRLTLLPLFRGDITEATRWSNWLQEEYPGTPITEAAAQLVPTWESNGNNLAAACQTITGFLESQDNPTGPLTDMGYNNPSLTAEDVCPIR